MTCILLVEDDEEIGRLLEHVLIAALYEVDRTYAVAGACSHLESHSYDLVIADGRLPDSTGMDIAKVAAEKGTKVLIITEYEPASPGWILFSVRLASVAPGMLARLKLHW